METMEEATSGGPDHLGGGVTLDAEIPLRNRRSTTSSRRTGRSIVRQGPPPAAAPNSSKGSKEFPAEFHVALDKQISHLREHIEEQAIKIAQRSVDSSEHVVRVSLNDLAEAIDTVTAGGASAADGC